MSYLVTISMPVYNVEKFIERALLSALNQTFESIEFLIVDDLGQDGSMEIVRKIKHEHPRGKHIRIIEHEKNGGLGKTRNTAIDNSKGRYLFFMDSDDYIAPKTIQLLYNVMSKEEVDVVAASDYEDVNGNVRKRYALPFDVENGNYAIAKWMEKTKLYFPIHTWNKLYRIDFLRENNIRCIVGHMVEDTWFTFQVVMKAQSVATISDFTYYYYINPNSHSRQSRDEKFFQQYSEIFDARKNMIENEAMIKTLPYSIYNFFIDPFFTFFLREAISQRVKGESCNNFIARLQDIYTMNAPLKRMFNTKNKFIFYLFKRKSFLCLDLYYKINSFLWHIYWQLNKIFHFSYLPYHHL